MNILYDNEANTVGFTKEEMFGCVKRLSSAKLCTKTNSMCSDGNCKVITEQIQTYISQNTKASNVL